MADKLSAALFFTMLVSMVGAVMVLPWQTAWWLGLAVDVIMLPGLILWYLEMRNQREADRG